MVLHKLFSPNHAAWYFWVFLSLSSCTTWRTSHISLSINKKLSREIVTEKVADWIHKESKQIIFIAPMLQERTTIFNRGEFLDKSKLFPEIFNADKKCKTFPFIIPDSLAQQVQYINSNADVEHGPQTFFFYSSLLPTRKKDIFAMQSYVFYSIQDSIFSARYATRHYDLYNVKNGRAQHIETLSAPEDFFNLPLPPVHRK